MKKNSEIGSKHEDKMAEDEFIEDIRNDPEMRQNINLYKTKNTCDMNNDDQSEDLTENPDVVVDELIEKIEEINL